MHASATLVRRSALAKHLKVQPHAIDRLEKTGAIPPRLPGTQYYVLEAAIERLYRVAAGMGAAPQESAIARWERKRAAR